MIIINIWGGPGVGKTRQAHDLFSDLRKEGINIDIIPEVAKQFVYNKQFETLEKDQNFVFGSQLHEIRIRDYSGVRFGVAECPLPLSIVYNRLNKAENFPGFEAFVMHEFNKYDNLNFFLKREVAYETVGRIQTEKQAKEVDQEVLRFLEEFKIEYTTLGIKNFTENVIAALHL